MDLHSRTAGERGPVRVGQTEPDRPLSCRLRVLGPSDLRTALAVCDRDPPANLFVASRLLATGLRGRNPGGELWGWYEDGELRSLCWSGANLVPVQATALAVEAFAARARRQGRQCSSIVGAAQAVLALWERLRSAWGPAREIRADQPLMVLDGPPAVPADPSVRWGRQDELDLLIPACIAMFTEEVGYSPVLADGGTIYRAQIASLVSGGRSLVRTAGRGPDRRIVFKAELGSVTPHAVQVQGVWVNPQYRGQGIAAPGMAAVVDLVRSEIAPLVSLYVNGFNTRAVRTYARVGFTQVGTFATVLF
ncbi:MAG: family N-acetyltransferase [Actinomycetota bacterium]|nr:family N-acetyltransferase [Actinomycetota bacterium]